MTAYNINNDYVLNEFYKPDWESLHDFHAERRDRLTRQAKSGTCDNESFKLNTILWDQIKVDNAICLKCFDTYQHQTVGDFLNWLLTGFDISESIQQDLKSRSFSSLQDAKDHLDGLYTQISKEEEEKQQAEWEAKMEEGRNYNSSDFKRSPNPNKPDIPPLTYSFWDKIKQRFYALLD
tara:strand:- start:85 stop:621 length:537 start_codon:yes stop_codon:yes gene_type:complete